MTTLKFLKKMMEDEMRTSKDFSLGSDEEFIKELSEAIEELEALESRSCGWCSQNKEEKPQPYMVNYADGVDGHYCIARKALKGFTEYWNTTTNRWCSAGTVFKLGICNKWEA